jgi:hypothetical protein
VPEGSLRDAVLQKCYDDPLAGYFGFERTLEVVSRSY